MIENSKLFFLILILFLVGVGCVSVQQNTIGEGSGGKMDNEIAETNAQLGGKEESVSSLQDYSYGCKKRLGDNSHMNEQTGKCECDDGHVFSIEEPIKCISANDYCIFLKGKNSISNLNGEKYDCMCKDGYKIDLSLSPKCIIDCSPINGVIATEDLCACPNNYDYDYGVSKCMPIDDLK
ncbi:MAG: hypothetical protein WA057_03875 [Candidatus Magasanikiibacteriota bacterium]